MRHLVIEPVRFWCGNAIEVVDPDRRVDDDQRLPTRVSAFPSALVQVAAPRDAPARPAYPRLVVRLHEQPQGALDDAPFGAFAASLQCCAHQVIVDVDVGSYATSMYNRRLFMCIGQRCSVPERG